MARPRGIPAPEGPAVQATTPLGGAVSTNTATPPQGDILSRLIPRPQLVTDMGNAERLRIHNPGVTMTYNIDQMAVIYGYIKKLEDGYRTALEK